MTKPLEWLANEIKEAEANYEEAKQTEEANYYRFEETMSRKYWEGYLDATINAYAGVYGPTPLEGKN